MNLLNPMQQVGGGIMYNVLDPYQSVSLTVLGLFFFSAELHLNHSLEFCKNYEYNA